jgi:hypothetical protein
LKSTLLILLVVSSVFTFAQETQIPVNEETQLAEYAEVVDATGSATDLYNAALVWINEYYPNPNGTINSKVAGESIEGKSRFKVKLTDKKGRTIAQSYVNYSFKLEFKENRYRYTIFKINWQQSSYFDVSRWEDKDHPRYEAETYPVYVQQTVSFFDDYIAALKAGVSRPPKMEKSDW